MVVRRAIGYEYADRRAVSALENVTDEQERFASGPVSPACAFMVAGTCGM